MSFCYKKILGVFTHLRVTTPNIIEPKFSNDSLSAFLYAKGGESGDVEGNTFNRRD